MHCKTWEDSQHQSWALFCLSCPSWMKEGQKRGWRKSLRSIKEGAGYLAGFTLSDSFLPCFGLWAPALCRSGRWLDGQLLLKVDCFRFTECERVLLGSTIPVRVVSTPERGREGEAKESVTWHESCCAATKRNLAEKHTTCCRLPAWILPWWALVNTVSHTPGFTQWGTSHPQIHTFIYTKQRKKHTHTLQLLIGVEARFHHRIKMFKFNATF